MSSKDQVRFDIDPDIKRRFKLALAKFSAEKKRTGINQTTLLIAYIKDFIKSQRV